MNYLILNEEIKKELREICSLFGIKLSFSKTINCHYFDPTEPRIYIYENHFGIPFNVILFHELGHFYDFCNGVDTDLYLIPSPASKATTLEIKSLIKNGYNHEIHADKTGSILFSLFYPNQEYQFTFFKNDENNFLAKTIHL